MDDHTASNLEAASGAKSPAVALKLLMHISFPKPLSLPDLISFPLLSFLFPLKILKQL